MAVVDANWLKTTRERAGADERELRRLTAERDRLDEEIKAVSERVRSWQVILASTNGAKDAVRGKPAGEPEPAELQQGLGFRAMIRDVLAAAPGGLRPKEVTARLRARGVTLPGTTNLAVRVGAELWKMKSTGQLKKRGGGYVLANPDSAERVEPA